MSEYIKREDVIDLLEQVLNAEEFFDTDNAKAQSDLALWFEERILELPKADVEPVRHGKWIKVDEQPYFRKHFHLMCCSVCHRKGYKSWNYCPNCGAKMDEKEQEYD